MSRKCLIPGCQNDTESKVCKVHWFGLPMAMRHRWWNETQYGKLDPSPDLLAAMKAAYDEKQAGKDAPNSGPAP